MIYVCRHFRIQELVYRSLFERFRLIPERLWMAFDPRELWTLDALRDRYGPCDINNWHNGGTRELCGLRPSDCEIGSSLSQHMFGRASDKHFRLATPDEVRLDILKNQAEEPFKFITRIERDTPGWVHSECGSNHDREKSGILVVSG